MPAHGRHHSAQWLTYEGQHFLIDCGEATQHQISRFGLKLHRLRAICISHLHADHVAGLAGLLTTLHLQAHIKPLLLWGPPGLRTFVEQQLASTYASLRYPLYVLEVWTQHAPVSLWEADGLCIEAFPLSHGIPTLGYRFQEIVQPRRLDSQKVEALGIDKYQLGQLRAEGRITWQGQVYTWDMLSLPPLPPRSYAYCSDTVYKPELAIYVKEVTLLYHEATFLANQAERAQQTFHTTAAQAAQLAQAARAQQLLIGHFSARYKDPTPLLHEARSIFPRVDLAKEGQTYPITHYVE